MRLWLLNADFDTKPDNIDNAKHYAMLLDVFLLPSEYITCKSPVKIMSPCSYFPDDNFLLLCATQKVAHIGIAFAHRPGLHVI